MALRDIIQGAATAIIGNLDLLAPTQADDAVKVLNAETFEQVFSGARPLEANVLEFAKVMEHPLEDGETITDHMVIEPIRIELPLMVVGNQYTDLYSEIRQLFRDGTLLIVQTRTGTYEDMLISEMPHNENADVFNGVQIALRLEEARFIEPSYGELPPAKVENKSQTSTVKKGTQQTKTTNSANTAKATTQAKASEQGRSSTLYRIFN